MKFKLLIVLICTLATAQFFSRPADDAGGPPEPPVLKLELAPSPEIFSAGGDNRLLLKVSIPHGYHLFAGEELSVGVESEGAVYKKCVFPAPAKEEGFDIYRGTVTLPVEIGLKDPSVSSVKGNLVLNWQGCQDFGDKVCFMPTSTRTPFEVKVNPSGTAGPVAASGASPAGTAPPPAPGAKDAGDTPLPDLGGFFEKGRFAGFVSGDEFEKWYGETLKGAEKKTNLFERMAKENALLAILVAMLFGFLSSLTPCVYPIIPITIAYIGSRSSGKGKFSGFVLSLFFVLGLALVYAALGVLSSALGVSFGSITQKPVVGISVAAVFALLGLSMIGLFQISMPGRFATKIEEGKKKGSGYLGAFLIGALSGLVASPCIGPLLLAILVIVASIGSILLGFLYLFAFALGMGILFLVIGTFSGALASLPKSGSWMDVVKVVFGSLIFAAAFYFGAMYMPVKVYFASAGCLVGFVSAFMFFGVNRHFLPPALRAVGAVLTLAAFLAVLPLTPAWESGKALPHAFETDMAAAAKKALSENKPLLLDFRADWCAYCIKLERETWPTPQAARVFEKVVPVKVDFTEESAFRSELEKKLNISGLPTVILLVPRAEGGSDGKNPRD